VGIVLSAFVPSAPTGELSKIDRGISKEPVYQHKPKYCLLVFGGQATARVWLVLDGDVLYVDRNGNGDLTDPQKRITMPAFKPSDHPCFEAEREVKIETLVVGGRTYTDFEFQQMRMRRVIKGETPDDQKAQDMADWILRHNPEGVIYSISLKVPYVSVPKLLDGNDQVLSQNAFADRNGTLQFADRRDKAPVVHFGAGTPLTFHVTPDQCLVRGSPTSELRVTLGTPGLGGGTFATTSNGHVPQDVHPVADIEFPEESGKEPIHLRVELTKRC
jgi:hypothetical protein